MPCVHKFAHHLTLAALDFEPTTLIVGTFNPALPNNSAEWFYGRTQHNHFWDVLPRLYNQPTLLHESPAQWQHFCHEHRIAMTDMLHTIVDADLSQAEHVAILSSYSDSEITKHFFDFNTVNIVRLLRTHPSIQRVYITRTPDTFWKHLLYPVKKYCEAYQIRLQPLLTPSGYAYFQKSKHQQHYPEPQLNVADYILMRWQEVWHPVK